MRQEETSSDFTYGGRRPINVYEYDLETGELFHRNEGGYIPIENLDKAKLDDGSYVYALRPYFTDEFGFLTYDTAIYSESVYNYYEKYILDETNYLNIAPAYTLFLTWAEDSYDGSAVRFEQVVKDISIGAGTSVINGGLYSASVAVTGVTYLGEGTACLLNGGNITTNWG